MILFQTDRLIVRRLEVRDRNCFATLFSQPEILEMIPQKPYSVAKIAHRFDHNRSLSLKELKDQKCDFGIYIKGNPQLIGLALFLINAQGENEMGYRFKPHYWYKGYATETARGMLQYYFEQLKVPKVTAEANILNLASLHILDQLMHPLGEYYSPQEEATFKRYQLEQDQWLQQSD